MLQNSLTRIGPKARQANLFARPQALGRLLHGGWYEHLSANTPELKMLLRILLSLVLLQAAVLLAAPSGGAATDAQMTRQPDSNSAASQLFRLGNQARAAQGVKALEWDSALAAAALAHCERMAAEGALSHQYADEPDIDVRASQAGAHFSLIEENVAMGQRPDSIHEAWMNSPHHRDNLLNPEVNRVGLAVVARGGSVYAVADFEHAVVVLSPDQVEAAIGHLVAANGVVVRPASDAARLACALDHGMPASIDNQRPEFIMRWQDSGLSRLPSQLLERMATGRYPDAVVGSCASQSGSAFTAYRVAVLLLKPASSAPRAVAASR